MKNRSGLFALFQIDSVDISFLFLKYLTKSVTRSQHSVIYPQSKSSSNLDGECSHLPVRGPAPYLYVNTKMPLHISCVTIFNRQPVPTRPTSK